MAASEHEYEQPEDDFDDDDDDDLLSSDSDEDGVVGAASLGGGGGLSLGLGSLNLSKASDQVGAKMAEEEQLRGEAIDVHCHLTGGGGGGGDDGGGQVVTLHSRMGFTVEKLKVDLCEQCGLEYAQVDLYLDDALMADPLALADFAVLKGVREAHVQVVVREAN